MKKQQEKKTIVCSLTWAVVLASLNSLVSFPLIFEYIPVFLCVVPLFPHETAYKSPLDQANGP